MGEIVYKQPEYEIRETAPTGTVQREPKKKRVTEGGRQLFPGYYDKKKGAGRTYNTIYSLWGTKKNENEEDIPTELASANLAGEYLGKDGSTDYQMMMAELQNLNDGLSAPVPADRAEFTRQIRQLRKQYEILILCCDLYAGKNFVFTATQKGRRRKRFAQRLMERARNEKPRLDRLEKIQKLDIWAGKRSFGDLLGKDIYTDRLDVVERGEKFVAPTDDRQSSLDLSNIEELDDLNFAQQAELKKSNITRYKPKKGGKLVGESMSRMIPIENLKSRLDPNQSHYNEVKPDTTYYFKRNVKDAGVLKNEKIRGKNFIPLLEEALEILKDNELVPAISESSNRIAPVYLRLLAMMKSSPWFATDNLNEKQKDYINGEFKKFVLVTFEGPILRSLNRGFPGDEKTQRENRRYENEMEGFLAQEEGYATGDNEAKDKIKKSFVKKFSHDGAPITLVEQLVDKVKSLADPDKIKNLEQHDLGLKKKLESEKIEYPVEYQGNLESVGTTMAAGDINTATANPAKRDVAYYKLDKLLGFNLVPQVFLVKDKHGREGRVMEQFKGKPMQEYLEEVSKDGEAGYAKIVQDKYLFKRLAEMHLLDLLANQIDRHAGNYTVFKRDDGSLDIQAFDNDLAFGSKGKGFEGMSQSGGMISLIPKEAAEKILALDMAKVRSELAGLLSEQEFAAMAKRLGMLKAKLNKEKDNLIDNDAWQKLTPEDFKKSAASFKGAALPGLRAYYMDQELLAEFLRKKNKDSFDQLSQDEKTEFKQLSKAEEEKRKNTWFRKTDLD